MKKSIIKELDLLKNQHGSLGRGSGVRYPESFKRRILELIQGGAELNALSRAAGVSVPTLQIWRKKSGSKNFMRIELPIEAISPKIRIFFDEKIWIELDEARLTAALIEKIRGHR